MGLELKDSDYTLQEYFDKKRGLFFPDGNIDIATVCLTCMSFAGKFYDHFPDIYSAYSSGYDSSLLIYASIHWAKHVGGKAEGEIMESILRFLNRKTKALSAWKIWSKNYVEGLGAEYSPLSCLHWEQLDLEDFHGILLAVSLGLTDVVEKLLSPNHGMDPLRMPPANSFKVDSLSIALEYGHEDIVHLLLNDAGIDLVEQSFGKKTPLMIAASVGDVAVTLELIRRRVPLDAKDDHKMTALHHAASGRHSSTARLLIDEGADIEARDVQDWNVAFHAVSAGLGQWPMWACNRGESLENYQKHRKERWNHMATLLLEYRVDLTIFNKYEETLLHESAKSVDMDIMRFCVKNGVNVQSKNSFQRQCLWNTFCSPCRDNGDEQNTIEIYQLLVENGANVNDTDMDKKTVLFKACQLNLPRISLWLLNHGADPLLADKEGHLAIYYAVQFACSDNSLSQTILAFLKHGIPINHKDNRGCTVLHQAACNTWCPREVFEVLIDDFGARVVEQDLKGRTPFHYAFGFGLSLEVIDFLLSRGADVNEQDFEGKTPLHVGRSRGFGTMRAFDFLHSRGADVNKQDFRGKTPLRYSRGRASLFKTVDLLISRNADINKQDFEGKTALHESIRKCSFKEKLTFYSREAQKLLRKMSEE